MTAAIAMAAAIPSFSQSKLEEGFANPPRSAKAYTWWHWMNGNISKEGITADLEAMKEAGVGGVQVFNVGFLTEGPIKYASDDWYDVTEWAIKEAERLDIEFDMHNCPGWSSSGGFWITPEYAAKQLSWSEAYVKGGKTVEMTLPQPDKAMDRYWDIAVVAYPSTKDEALMENSVKAATLDGKALDPSLLSMNSRDNDIVIEKELVLELDHEVSISTLRGFMKNLTPPAPQGMGFNPMPAPVARPSVEVSQDGKNFQKAGDINVLTGVPSYAAFTPSKAKYVRISVPSAIQVNGLQLTAAPMNEHFLRQSDYVISVGSAFGQPFPFARNRAMDASLAIDADDVIDITSCMDAQGHLRWDAPKGDWTIIRLGCVPIERRQQSAPASGNGLEIDKYSREALKFHWDFLLDRLTPALESVAEHVKAGMLIDSYETGNMNWTPKMMDEFKSRRGYNLLPYIPALVGKYVGGVDLTESFLWDFRRTCADLFADNYLAYMGELCHAHGILLYNEPYNTSMFDEMQVGSRADIPMGEFWVRTHQDRLTLKLASSVAHVNGKRVDGNQIVGAESYTGWEPDAAYQNYPYSLKAQGDDAFTLGLNRFIFHRFAHQPNNNVAPGMSMGNIGFHFDRNNTWFEKGKQWLTYAARCQYLLQQGNIVADVLYLLDEQVPASAHTRWNPELPVGYWGDAINAESFLSRMRVGNGTLVGPEGVHYALLLLQDISNKQMTLDVLKKVSRYVKAGGTVLGPAPVRAPGIISEEQEKEYRSLVSELWGGLEKGEVKRVGKGQVMFGLDVKSALDRIGVIPDVEYSFEEDAPIGFIHRVDGDADIYFLANHRRTNENPTITFRVDGKRPELWNADTGDITPVDLYEILPDGRVRLSVPFDPVGSWFVVFRDKGTSSSSPVITKDGEYELGVKTFAQRNGGFYSDVHDTFTMSMWLRPEPNSSMYSVDPAHRPASPWGSFANSYPYYPGNGSELYGSGHSVVSVNATRAGVAVMERSSGANPVAVASYDKPIGSWNHVAVVYNGGVPTLYVNGEKVYTGKKSSFTVHPSYKDIAVASENLSFEGDFSDYEIIGRALDASEIRAKADAGVKEESSFGADVTYKPGGGYYLFANGNWSIGGKTVQAKGISSPKDLTGGTWTVSFPEKLGAPSSITMNGLSPLQENSDPGVKYFSGTATYKIDFTLGKTDVKGKSLFLDLGKVYVIASVKLNGKDLGILWKAPFMVDITSAARQGENHLEVEVANLWTNRLIGDAFVDDGQVKGAMMQAPLPSWYQRGEAKPEDGRVAYSVAKFFDKDDILYDSGLVGPVVIREAIAVQP